MFWTWVNEHIPKCIFNFIKKAVINVTKRSSIAKHLFNNVNCANNYDLLRYMVIKNYRNYIYLVRLEAILIFLNKPELCKQKEFDYKVSLFI